jgi:diguanylate cyclase (GGDEF)-like protein/PAS domain S-box-containing protein
MSDARRMSRACVLTALAGVVALVIVVAADGAHVRWDWPWLFFFGVLTVTYGRPIPLWRNGQAESIFLDDALFIPMILLLTPTEQVTVVAASVLLGQLWRRAGFHKTIWNFGTSTTAAAIGIGVTRLTLRGPMFSNGHPSPAALGAGFVGVLAFGAVSTVAVAHIISLVQRRPFTTTLLDGLVMRIATWAASVSLGVLVAFAAARQHVILFVVIVPVAVLHIAYLAALGQRRERQRLEAIYEAAGSIQDSIDTHEVRDRLVTAAQRLAAADSAVLVSADDASTHGALRVAVDGSLALEVRDRIGGDKWDSHDEDILRTLAGVTRGALHNAELYEQLRVITSSLGEGVFGVDGEGKTVFMNPAAVRMLGWTEDDLIGRPLHDAVGADHDFESCHLHQVLQTGETVRNDDTVFTSKDGRLLPVASTTAPVIRDGEVAGAVVTFRDVTERKAFELQLAHQAFHDALSGLPNRALFLDRLAHAMARSRQPRMHALLFVDIDRFKVVNDSLGHQVGDQLLVAVADRLRHCLRRGDTLARFGGDEFTVLVEDIDGPAEAMTAAERIATALQAPFHLCEREIVVTVSVGIACTDGVNRTPDELVAFADIAMYRAKSKGGGCADMYDAETEDRALQRLELEISLRQAIDNGDLEVHYQPVMYSDTGRIHGMEALVRWNHPTLGQVLPGGFISLAEETGLIVALGRYVLLEACCQTVQWQRSRPGAPPLSISVNLSTRQLQRATLVEEVADILAVSGLDASNLCLEITESAMLEEAPIVAGNLNGLKRLGVRLAIDDFGTGYSSLSYLKRFPVDEVKIDRSFTSGLGQRDVDRDIVIAVVQLARAIGADAVAEGVETPAQLEALQAVGCPLAQGFYLGRPQPKDVAEQLLDELWAAPPQPKGRTRAEVGSK